MFGMTDSENSPAWQGWRPEDAGVGTGKAGSEGPDVSGR